MMLGFHGSFHPPFAELLWLLLELYYTFQIMLQEVRVRPPMLKLDSEFGVINQYYRIIHAL